VSSEWESLLYNHTWQLMNLEPKPKCLPCHSVFEGYEAASQ